MTSESDFVQGYDDAQADLVLKSNDGKHFRVHSYILRASSSVLPGMLILTSDCDGDKPIDVDYPAVEFKLFLDLLSRPRFEIPRAWQHHKHLYQRDV